MRKIQCETCALRGEGVVCDLPLEALDDFRSAGMTSLYKPRQVVFSEGSPSLGLYLICHGSVKLYHSDRFGHDHILEVAEPGAVLGELVLEGQQEMSVSAEALTDSQLCFLPTNRLVNFVQSYPMTGVRIIAALSRELAGTRRKVRDLALKGAESRLACLLMDLARDSGQLAEGHRVQLRYTRRELAEMIGVSTETAIRLMGKLKTKGALSIEGRTLVITDPAKLEKIASHDEIGH